MGGRIPKVILDRATSPQQRWGEDGQMHEVTPHDTGLHQDLVVLFSDGTKLKQIIEELVTSSIISIEGSTDGAETYICQCESARISYDQNRVYWIHQAFELCCYVFPRDYMVHCS